MGRPATSSEALARSSLYNISINYEIWTRWRGASEGLRINDPYKDYISTNRILKKGRDCPDTPMKRNKY